MDLAVIALSFAAIFVVELPDKTFIAALVLSTRYRGIYVWIGVGLAFLVQTLIAVTVGRAVSFLPDDLVKVVAAAIFLFGAILLIREAPKADAAEAETEEEFAAKATASKTGLAAIGTSFIVLFAAEWGDLSQLLTISLVGKYDEPVSVFLGAWGALLAVSGLAVVAGRFLLRHLKLSRVFYAGAAICLVLEALTLYELAT
ncbi:TMEM165/GDT1 family protein [Nocardioides marmoriginsengisoli]|uniref:GDT1 family protein n=1 Tax=Nocardioides marmoriginsengisoli TaxID=661483 RepID=A0A3N0CGB4_9ACTN|nr:TMEM165/GDT1 family protein [Nocardioides marmoriginsengisoli]RNL62056.1 TMEM165/GDT1 family protein [Nocardioides marmoriginsengisoli]